MAHPIQDIEFQHLLAHTFPGLILALAVFMILDIFSLWNLTSEIRDINIFLLFMALMILIGTILGVILDALHHSIIEEIVFDNLEGAYYLDKKLKKLCPWGENEKYDFWKHHYFLPFLGKDPIEKLNYITNYYRYSEFYTNMSVALVAFSFAIPLYLFSVMQIRWRLSIILGIVSLLIAVICINEGYMAHKRFIRALISFLCGLVDMKRLAKSENCKEPPHDIDKIGRSSERTCGEEYLSFLLFNFFIFYMLLKTLIFYIQAIPFISRISINPWTYIIGFSLIALVTYISYSCAVKKPSKDGYVNSKHLADMKAFLINDSLSIIFIPLIIVFSILCILFVSLPPQIAIDPSEIFIEKNDTNNSNQIYSISISNIESELIKIRVECKGINWMKLSGDNYSGNNTTKLTRNNICRQNKDFINVNLTPSEPIKNGLYKGEIMIYAESEDGIISESIPINIKYSIF